MEAINNSPVLTAEQKFSNVFNGLKAGAIHGAGKRAQKNVHGLALDGALTQNVIVVASILVAGLPGLLIATAIQGAAGAYAERAAYHAGFAAGQAAANSAE